MKIALECPFIFQTLLSYLLLVRSIETRAPYVETYSKMLTTRALSALIVASLPLSSIALTIRQSEVPGDLVERGLRAIGINSNTTGVRNVRISGSQFRTKSIITTIALDGMDSTVVPYGSQTITYSYEEGGPKQRIDKVAGLGSTYISLIPPVES
jgi:hypothetical protein